MRGRGVSNFVTLALAAALILLIAGSRIGRERGGAPLVIAALHVLERDYVEPVRPAPLLNAAVVVLRSATHLTEHRLPAIPDEPEREAAAAFQRDFGAAAGARAAPSIQLAYLATAGMLASLHDSHTFYLPPAAYQEAQRETQGRASFTGIGVTIAARRDASGTTWIFVQDVLPGSPAQAAGLRRFDRIVQTGASSLKNANVLDASRLLRGKSGTTVSLAVLRESRTLHFSVRRAPITVPPVAARALAPGLVYLRVYEFGQDAGSQLRRELQAVRSGQAVAAAILDLRGNPGGLVTEAENILGLFLPTGDVAAQDMRRAQHAVLRTTGTPVLIHTPLAVLIDGGSASASELVSAALKDYRRAALVGEKTAGALGGAIMVALPAGGMSVTVERILSPHGARIEDVGVTPTRAVPLTAEEMERGDDAQLSAAVRMLTPHGTAPARPAAADWSGAASRGRIRARHSVTRRDNRERPAPRRITTGSRSAPGARGPWAGDPVSQEDGMHISSSARAISPSMTIGMDDRARRLRRKGVDVISFAAGEPDFDTPDVIKRAANTAIQEGFTKYTAPAGIPELRQAVAARLEADYGARYAPEEVVITAGGKPALFYALRAICDPGDEVLVPVPAWVSYIEQVKLAGARAVPVPTEPADDFQPAPARIAPLITPRTRAFLVNSPHNPTGTVYRRETLEALVALSREHEFILLSDEIYEAMVYDGARHYCLPAEWREARERIVLLNSMSKTYAMTGWRIGYAACPAPVASAITDIQAHLAGNPNSIAQRAALAALEDRVDPKSMVAEYDRRRKYIVSRLNELPGVRCARPRGAFYAFPDVRGVLGRPGGPATSAALSEYLLDAAHVAVVPGEAFEAPGFIRLSYATSMPRIEEGLDRIGRAVGALS